MNKSYVNSTDGVLSSRNPRLELQPGEALLVTPEMMSYSIRMWIRSGALLLEQADATKTAVEPDVAKKPAAKKTAVKKPSAAKVPAKK